MPERSIANARDAITDGDTRQAIAIIERIIADGGDRVSDCYTCKALTIIERMITDGCNRQVVICAWNYNIGIGASTNAYNRITLSIIV